MCEVTLTRASRSKFTSFDGEEEECCWICMGAGTEAEPLHRPCKCPRTCHQSCISRWQLQQAGKAEEHTCRFCGTTLPDWKNAHAHLPKAPPTMTVVHNGVAHQITVMPGKQGHDDFVAAVRRIYNLAPDETIQLTFGCRLPGSNQEVVLEGGSCFGAAVHLASLSAGERMRREQQQLMQVQQSC